MKVLCFNSGMNHAPAKPYTDFEVKENSIYDVLGEKNDNGVYMYLIYDGPECQLWYNSRYFVPLTRSNNKKAKSKPKKQLR